MGLSGILLKRKDEINPLKLIEDIKVAAEKAGLFVKINDNCIFKDDGSFRYTTANITNTLEDVDERLELLMYVYGESESVYDKEYDWIIRNGLLNQVINIEDFDGCEKILLDFVYEYMELNPNDIFWNELKWFYKYKDIALIHKQAFDREWCYKNPEDR